MRHCCGVVETNWVGMGQVGRDVVGRDLVGMWWERSVWERFAYRESSIKVGGLYNYALTFLLYTPRKSI